jgi:lysophospholipase L1-like esterase
MNSRQSLLFFCSVLAGLAMLCICFPSEGLPLGGGFRLRFPNLREVMEQGAGSKGQEGVFEEEDTLPDLTPEELLQMRQDALNAKQIEEFRAFCKKDAARIFMPNGDEAYLDGFWEALQLADTRHVRIMHYGDSQIECDRITSLLRQKFQEEFGGMGVGLVPALQTIPTFTLSSSITPDDVPQYLSYGPADMRSEDNFYGPLARVTHIPERATIRLTGIGGKDYSRASRFSRITVITRQPATLLLKTNEEEEAQEMMLESGSEPCFYTTTYSRGINRITLEVEGETDILGIQLDGQTGIDMDNIPMRGSSGSNLTNISRSSLRPFFNRENVALVILQFGGNSMPYLNTDNLHDFKESVKHLINTFHELEPDAKVLFIGPADMARNREDGELESYPILPALNDSLRAAADETGAAFWNMYAAMGGRGSIIRWVETNPQLAGEDYIHFTPLGAKKIAQLLYDTLHLYYRFYLFRTGQENVELTAEDSAAVNIIKQEEKEE